jgi:hypothetical protein
LVSRVRRAIEKRCINIETTRDITKRQKKRVAPGADLDVCLPIMGLDYLWRNVREKAVTKMKVPLDTAPVNSTTSLVVIFISSFHVTHRKCVSVKGEFQHWQNTWCVLGGTFLAESTRSVFVLLRGCSLLLFAFTSMFFKCISLRLLLYSHSISISVLRPFLSLVIPSCNVSLSQIFVFSFASFFALSRRHFVW